MRRLISIAPRLRKYAATSPLKLYMASLSGDLPCLEQESYIIQNTSKTQQQFSRAHVGGVVLLVFCVYAFGVRKNVIYTECNIALCRSSVCAVLASNPSGGGSLRNTGGVSVGWRRDAAGCAFVLARIQPDNRPEFAAERVSKKSNASCCTAATAPQLCRRSPPSRAAA